MSVVTQSLRAFRRRLHTGLVLGGLADGVAAAALALAVAVVAARIFGVALTPRPAWAFLALVPAACACLRLRRGGLPRLSQAAHLDVRLGLEGLLVTAAETRDGSASAWQEQLDTRLRDLRRGLPAIRGRALLLRAGVPAAVLFGVCLLPPPPAPDPVRNPQVAQALADLAQDLELAAERGVIPEPKLEELSKRAAELRERMESGSEVGWSDVDALRERMAQERGLREDALQKTAHALAALRAAKSASRSDTGGIGDPGDAEARAQDLMRAAAAAGLLNKLPEGVDAEAGLAGDQAALDALADALGKLAQEEVQAMQGMLGEGALEGADLDLQALLDQLGQGQGQGGDGEPVAGGVPGRGGVTRGPGHATLELNENFDGDTSALVPTKLPPGRIVPKEWEVTQSRRADPDVAPVRHAPTGGDAAGGAGEAAWRRRLAPRHRDVVREFFDARQPTEKK